jgi:hypothetical protein
MRFNLMNWFSKYKFNNYDNIFIFCEKDIKLDLKMIRHLLKVLWRRQET